MKLATAVVVVLCWSSAVWAQSDEIERLTRIVNEQTREIDELKTQLTRIERALSTISPAPPAAAVVPAVVSAALVTPARTIPPAQTTQAPTTQQLLEQQKAVVTQTLANKWYEKISIRGYTQFRHSNV